MRMNHTVARFMTVLQDQYVKTGSGWPAPGAPDSSGAPALTWRIMSHPAITASPPYSRVNVVMEMMTSAAETPGETLCDVFRTPNTVHGWRPISVKIQPMVMARYGSTEPQMAAR